MTDAQKKNGAAPNGEYSSPLKFPCDFIIKVMGESTPEFETRVLAIVQQHFPQVDAAQFTKRPSKDNNYIALTVTVYAESKAQLDACYQDLSSEPMVLMAL